MKKILVFNGIHGSGKSTLATKLGLNSSQFTYFYEIGGKLRTQVDYNTVSSGIEFGREVMNREFTRDAELLNSPTIPVVETWHIGNLAYVMARSPELLNEYKTKLQEQLKLFEPVGFTFEISPNIFIQRMSEIVSAEDLEKYIGFFNQINQNILDLYKSLGIKHYVINNDGPLYETNKELAQRLKENGINPEGTQKGVEYL